MFFKEHRARKRFGQHWLKDQSVLDEIINSAQINSQDRILEIGPGQGALTQKLLNTSAKNIHAIEIDDDLVFKLQQKFTNFPGFTLVKGDVLSLPLHDKEGNYANKVVANIPYNITGPILKRLVGALGKPLEHTYTRLVLLLQKEVSDRILAPVGSKTFSALSIRMQLLAECFEVCIVPPNSFEPPPKVFSSVLVIKPFPLENRLSLKLEYKINTLLHIAFMSRRKKLRNTLMSISPLDKLEIVAKDLGISLDIRPQELSPSMWISLAKQLTFNLDQFN